MVTIPTFSEIYNDVLNDLQSQFSINIPVFGPIILRAIAAVWAGHIKLLYLGLANVQKNIWPDTADPVAIGGTLERFGLVKIGRNPFPAVAAKYTVQVSGIHNAVIPAQQQFISDATALSPGMLFILDAAYTCAGANDFITLRALTPGTVSQLVVGNTLTAASPIAGVVQTGNTVTAQVVQPLDAETIEAYRIAVKFAFTSQPQGGSATDYILWSEAVQGVAAVYPYAISGAANEINLYIESDVADSTDGHGTPNGAMISAVSDQIEGTSTIVGKRPLGVFLVNYLAITPLSVTVNITGANPAFTSAQQQAIISTITDWINTVRPFIAAAYILADKNDTIDLNNIILQTLTAAPGTSFGAVTLTVNGVQVNSYQFINGNIPYVPTGGITFN